MKKENISWSKQEADVCAKCDIRTNYSVVFTNLTNTSIEYIHHFTSGIPADTIIYEQGNKDEYVYTVKSGIVAIIETDDNLKERIVELSTKGMTIGLESIDSLKYSQSAIALTPVSLCKIKLTKKHLDSSQNYLLSENISKTWQEKYNNQIKTTELSVGSTNERLTKLFHFMAQHTYIENDNEFYMLSLKHISLIIGISIENSSRTLSKMKNENITKIETKRFKHIN